MHDLEPEGGVALVRALRGDVPQLVPHELRTIQYLKHKYKMRPNLFVLDSRRVLVGTPGTKGAGAKYISNPDVVPF